MRCGESGFFASSLCLLWQTGPPTDGSGTLTHTRTQRTHAARSRCTPASSPASRARSSVDKDRPPLVLCRPVVRSSFSIPRQSDGRVRSSSSLRHSGTHARSPINQEKKNKIWRKFSLDFFHSSVARLRASPRRTSMFPPLRTRLLLLLLVERDERDVGDFDDLEADAGWRRDTTSWRKLPVTKSTARKRASEHARAQAASGVHPRARVSRAAGDACSLPPLSVRSCHDTCGR